MRPGRLNVNVGEIYLIVKKMQSAIRGNREIYVPSGEWIQKIKEKRGYGRTVTP
jgi:hypothetical protein